VTVLRNDAWVPFAKSIGTGVVAAVVLAVSAVQLVVVAELCHITPNLSWTLPVALDIGGAVATVVWTKSTGHARMWGMAIALFSLLESLTGNVLSDLLQAHLIDVTPWLIIGIGAVYPINLFLMIHLLVVSSGGAKQAKARHAAPAPRRTEAVREPVKVEQPAVVATTTKKPIEVAKPSNVREIHQGDSKRERARAYFMEQVLVEGRDPLDKKLSAAECDRAVGANGYSKSHIDDWRAEALAAIRPGAAVAGN
jgi:hypothetical protein